MKGRPVRVRKLPAGGAVRRQRKTVGRPLKGYALQRVYDELMELMLDYGPFFAFWCEESLLRRDKLLMRLGNPATCIVHGVNPETGETVAIGDVANLRSVDELIGSSKGH